jgi:hypothetical protein
MPLDGDPCGLCGQEAIEPAWITVTLTPPVHRETLPQSPALPGAVQSRVGVTTPYS